MAYDVRVGELEFRVEVVEEGEGFRVRVGEREYRVDAVLLEEGRACLLIGGRSYEVFLAGPREAPRAHVGGRAFPVEFGRRGRATGPAVRGADEEGPAVVASLMSGRVVKVLVEEGERVEAGQGVVVVEAMKMENELKAPRAGVVKEVCAKAGESVEGGVKLVVVE